MAGRNKGFDPLSSLFEAPDLNRGLPLPDIDEDEGLAPAEAAPIDLHDPLMKRPTPGGPPTLPPEEPEDPASDGLIPEAEPLAPVEDKVALARRLAAEALARAQAAPPPAPARPRPSAGDEDKAALARRVAAEAVARAAAASAAQAAAAPVAAPTPVDQDKLALARKLAAEATARAAAAAAAPPLAPTPAEAPRAKGKGRAKAGSPPSEERARAGRSRVDALAARARKPMSALEAAREASRAEEERHAQDLRKEANRLRDVVQELIPEWLPGIGAVFVANAIAVQQRDLLRALWRGHRSKFLADGQLERAVGAAAVLSALDKAPEGTLVAAHAVTDASDYLVWLDLDKRSLVAAFPDARAFFSAAT